MNPIIEKLIKKLTVAVEREKRNIAYNEENLKTDFARFQERKIDEKKHYAYEVRKHAENLEESVKKYELLKEQIKFICVETYLVEASTKKLTEEELEAFRNWLNSLVKETFPEFII